MDLNSPVAALGPIAKRAASILKSVGVLTVKDLIFYFPYRYEDFSRRVPISQTREGESVTFVGTVEKVSSRRSFRRRMTLIEAVLSDSSGKVTALWFNQSYLLKALVKGTEYRFAGKITKSKFGTRMINPLYEPLAGVNSAYVSPFIPVYSLPKGISQYALRRLVRSCEPLMRAIPDDLPEEIRSKYGLMRLDTAVIKAHFPLTHGERDGARRRLGFDELFKVELAMAELRRLRSEKIAPAVPFDEAATKALVASLPFKLTDDQRRAAWEGLLDMKSGRPMNRLLNGDVGSGKTVVAAIMMLNAARAGFQSAFMAPTEILARQHFESLKKIFAGQPFSVALWTNSYKRAFADGREIVCANKTESAGLADDIAAGRMSVIIGTHALIEDALHFSSLALAVIDEQHRFGVKARQLLCSKGGIAGAELHLLSMTATPIPRSLALTVFGDLDLSLLRKKPKDRQVIETRIVPASRRAEAYAFARREMETGRQVFVICPLIEESEALEVVSAEEEFARLGREDFAGLPLGLLHGRMTATEKEDTMRDFLERKTMALVSTSVIEVGIDVPNATVMCITGAERFGLAQLHQFRGRVGRSEHKSYCLLMPTTDEAAEKDRLRAMVELRDGFELAEKDLFLRGPGEILGETQSGFPAFRVASLGDVELIKEAKQAADEYLLSKDSEWRSGGVTEKQILKEAGLETVHLE